MPTPKIQLVTLDYPPERGGVARYLGNLVKESNGAISVTVPEGHDASGPGIVSTAQMSRKSWPHWWPLVRLSRNTEHRTSIILVSHVFPVGTASWISKLFGGPDYALIFHGLDIRLAQGAWKRWLLRRICRKATHLFTNSEFTKKELLKLVPKSEVTVITPGVEQRKMKSKEDARRLLALEPQQKIVLSIARLVSRKGVDVSIKALSRIQTKSDVLYVVLGDGPERQRLEQLAAESKTQIRWILDADDETKWLWLSAADVFLLPVREEREDVEGFGIVYLEAALAGVPSIAGKSGGAGEAVIHEQTGLLVNPKSIDDVEQGIIRLLDDAELRLKLGQQAKERAQKDFRWSDRWLKMSRVLSISYAEDALPADDIAVVVPCYNHAEVLPRTLEALARQTLVPAEVVVVDDGSSDDAASVVKNFDTRLQIRFIRFETNRGAPAARNEGARLTTSPFLIFLDADAVLVPDALAAFRTALKNDGHAAFAYSNFYWGAKRFRAQQFDGAALKIRNFIHTSSLLRRSAFPGFDESLKKFQDWDLWLTIAERGSTGVWIDRELYRIEPRKQGISRWLPRVAYLIPWNFFGFQPKEVGRYREAETIVKTKHKI